MTPHTSDPVTGAPCQCVRRACASCGRPIYCGSPYSVECAECSRDTDETAYQITQSRALRAEWRTHGWTCV